MFCVKHVNNQPVLFKTCFALGEIHLSERCVVAKHAFKVSHAPGIAHPQATENGFEYLLHTILSKSILRKNRDVGSVTINKRYISNFFECTLSYYNYIQTKNRLTRICYLLTFGCF